MDKEEIPRIVNYRRAGGHDGWRAGVLSGDAIIALEDVTTTEPALSAVARPLTANSGAVLARDRAVLGPPVLHPGKIVAAAANYVDHVAEMPGDRGTIERQGFFLKAPSSVLAPGGTVRLPYPGRRTDYEGELAVIIAERVHKLTEDDALDAVLGYTCLIDVSLRGEEDRGFRKSFDTFTPLGEAIVPARGIDLQTCELTTTVNGEVRQQTRLDHMIYPVPRLLAWISSVMTLEPGDIVATGTPKGVGPMAHGDEVTVTITDVGSLTVTVAER